MKTTKKVQVLNLLDLKIILHEDNSVETDMHNFKVQRQTPRQVKILLFVRTYYLNINNKSSMQTVKNKFKNIRNEHLKSI